MKKLILLLAALLSFSGLFAQSYAEHLAKAKQYEKKGQWCYALGEYYDALATDEDPLKKDEAWNGYSELAEMICEGNPGRGEFDIFEYHDQWKKLLAEAEHFANEINTFTIVLGKLERGILNYENRTASYNAKIEDFYFTDKMIKTVGIIEEGYRNARMFDWFDMPEEWPYVSVIGHEIEVEEIIEETKTPEPAENAESGDAAADDEEAEVIADETETPEAELEKIIRVIKTTKILYSENGYIYQQKEETPLANSFMGYPDVINGRPKCKPLMQFDVVLLDAKKKVIGECKGVSVGSEMVFDNISPKMMNDLDNGKYELKVTACYLKYGYSEEIEYMKLLDDLEGIEIAINDSNVLYSADAKDKNAANFENYILAKLQKEREEEEARMREAELADMELDPEAEDILLSDEPQEVVELEEGETGYEEGNLFFNPRCKLIETLEDGYGWEFERGVTDCSYAKIKDGEIIINCRDFSPWANVHFSQGGFMLKPNTKYRVSFVCYGKAPKTIEVHVANAKNGAGYVTKGFVINNKKLTYVVEFTTPKYAKQISAYITFGVSKEAVFENVHFKNLVLEEVE